MWFGKLFIGLTLAYRLNRCLMLIATDLGVPGAESVVVGPLKQQSASSRTFQVASGMKLGPLFFSHHQRRPHT